MWTFHEYSDGVYEIAHCDFKNPEFKYVGNWLRSDGTEVTLSSTGTKFKYGNSVALRRGDFWYVGGSKSDPAQTSTAYPLLAQI